MGCGGSRTDALEPRYLESWTKETESTWLTSTDTDIPLSSIQSIPSDGSEAGSASEKTISPGKTGRAEGSGAERSGTERSRRPVARSISEQAGGILSSFPTPSFCMLCFMALD